MFIYHATTVIIFSNFFLLVLGGNSNGLCYEFEYRGEGGRRFIRNFDRFYVFDLAVQ
jgi:hypothetical protein